MPISPSYYSLLLNPKAFIIHILTASSSQNRDSKCFRIYIHFLITLGDHFFDP